jgi:hypothetical protein
MISWARARAAADGGSRRKTVPPLVDQTASRLAAPRSRKPATPGFSIPKSFSNRPRAPRRSPAPQAARAPRPLDEAKPEQRGRITSSIAAVTSAWPGRSYPLPLPRRRNLRTALRILRGFGLRRHLLTTHQKGRPHFIGEYKVGSHFVYGNAIVGAGSFRACHQK